ncbi:MAG: cytosine permease [Methanobrevibacter sp.]|uniref:cytosine permease n=1 Tax=Methanobrevibacter sp. TaxID=66852 RepID=UPI001B28CC6C|nr:cytosine permease [Methanobrevibacter sp.]MBO5150820.1 cytosine permease [Methanobrevibacter sp.]
MKNRTGLFTNAVIWFGVAISVSEIQAGVQIASAAPINSIWIPLILGHIIGGILLFSVGLIGARLRVNAMESIRSTFGNFGSKFFASLNVMQLIAWVAVLNAQGALALMGLNLPISFPATCFILAILVAIWVFIGLQRSSKVTTVVMIVLTMLLIVLSVKLSGINTFHPMADSPMLGFWNIFEISIAMPVSWLPVISDYTKDAQKPVKATAVSALAYTIASLWMYFIGVAVVGVGTTDISQAILISGLGVQGVIIMVLSTVTTNFLATNSAGESAKAIFNRLDPKVTGVIVSILSALLAISGIMDHYIGFLYLITSVFAPMAAVLLVSFYLGNGNNETGDWYFNIFAWIVGFIIYQATVNLDSILLGPTLLSVIASGALAYIWIKIKKKKFCNF